MVKGLWSDQLGRGGGLTNGEWPMRKGGGLTNGEGVAVLPMGKGWRSDQRRRGWRSDQ
jgi:hypothetical protein